MALPRKGFYSKLKGKNTWNYTTQLDYSLNTYEERKALVDKIMVEDDFFVEYFDNYYKVDVSQDDFLSEDNNICQALEKISDYLLFSPDKKEKREKVKYVFYATDKLLDRMKKEKSVEELVDQYSNMGYDEVIAFLIDQGTNFRKENKQRIFSTDYMDRELINYFLDCRDIISHFRKILKTEKLTFKQRRLIMKFLGEIKSDMLIYKDKIKGTIYFKALMNGSEEPEYQMFNFTDEEQVAALLKCTRNDLESDLGILNYDLNQLLEQINLSPTESEILRMWRNIDSTQETIAEELDVKREFVTATIKKIINKIVKQYKENYEDWLYLNYLKGSYKKCSVCGEIKLINGFGKHPNTKDGLYPSCRECRREN